MVLRVLIFNILFMISACTIAQSNITGTVKDADTGKGVSDVYLMLMNKDGKTILSYSFTSDKGEYTLPIPQNGKKIFLLTTTRMGYEPYKKEISTDIHTLDILLKESPTQLREVKIVANPIKQRGDTINYSVSGFVKPQDKKLADVLARMPGIEVQKDGQIQYGGKPINKFYIEDMNLLEQRYSLATENLSPKDIATVQVYENHEPIKMLQNISDSEQAALNIKLKDGAKSKWLTTIDFGVSGFPFLYNANATMARFNKSNQSLLLAKANNTGKNIFQELKLHTLKPGSVFYPNRNNDISDMFSTLSGEASFFTHDRARFNTTVISSLNQLWKTGKNKDLRYNLNYGFEREKRERSTSTQYNFENAPSITLFDQTSQIVRWHKLENELTFTTNENAYFFEEKIDANFHWKDALGEIIRDNNEIRQKLHLPRVNIKNNSLYKKLINGLSIGIENQSSFTQLPHTLKIAYDKPISVIGKTSILQEVKFRNIGSNTSINLLYNKGRHTFEANIGLESEWQSLQSELEGAPTNNEVFVNNLSWNAHRYYFEPSYKIEYNQWTFKTSVSTNYFTTDYNAIKKAYIYLNPSFRLKYEPNGALNFFISYSENIKHGDVRNMHTGYIMTQYDSFSKGIDLLQKNNNKFLSWGGIYKDMSHFFSANYMGTYFRTEKNLYSANSIQDGYRFSWLEFGKTPNNSFMNRLSLMKLFFDWSLSTGLEISYNQNFSQIKQQDILYPYKSSTYIISPSIKWSKLKNLNLEYSMKSYLSTVSSKNFSSKQSSTLINQELNSYWNIRSNFSVNTTVQHFHNKIQGYATTNLLFLDLGCQYDFKKITLNIDWTNILNTKQDVRTFFNSINTIQTIDKLRPSEILFSIRFKK